MNAIQAGLPSDSHSVLYRSPVGIYPQAESSSGMYIKDGQGKRYLDMSGGAAVSAVGHSNPHVCNRIQEQLSKLASAHTSFFTNRPQEELAERLVARFTEPGARAYFTSGGSEANETALKMVWQYWANLGKPEKKVIISREHSYHGNTFGTLSVSGNDGRRKKSSAPLLDWPRISPCYAYRFQNDEETLGEYARRTADQLETAILEQGADNVAAFICEPVVGSSLGAVPAAPGYLRRIREICDKYSVLFIADEVMCGSGRTGTYFAHEQDGVTPDIVTLAKGIGGGYLPLAATVIRSHLAEVFDRGGFAHGYTYIGHALACTAGCAVMDVLDTDDLLAKCREKGQEFGKLLTSIFSEHPQVGDIRGRGLFWAIELVADKKSKKGFDSAPASDCDFVGRALATTMDEGLICYPGGTMINGSYVPHILLAPPMILEHVHMEECVNKLAKIIQRILP